MARSAPYVYVDGITNAQGMEETIIAAEGVFFVTYNGKPFNRKSVKKIDSVNGRVDSGPSSYSRTCFVNSGHAFNLANKLNNLYECEDFAVHQVTASMLLRPAGWINND